MAVNINVPSQVKTYANLAAFPATGALKTIYIAEDTNKTYRWTGSVYVEVSGADFSGYVPTSRTLTINGVTQDLSANRTFTISTGITIGSTAIASGVVGRVLFEGAGNVVQESSSLFWDATNNRLGIGTSSPSHKLAVYESNSSENVSARFETANANLNYIYLKSAHSANHFIQTNASGILISADENGTNGYFRIKTNNINALSVTNTQNVLIGTTTDAGFKFDVNGTARVSGATTITPAALTGSDATSALDISQTWNTTGTPSAIKLNVTDTASNVNSRLLDIQIGGASKLIFGKNGRLFFGTFNNSSNIQGNDTSKGLIFSTSMTSVIGNGFEFSNLQGNINNVSSTSNGLLIKPAGILGFNPTSGTGLYNTIHINDLINQTGTATGITRGLYINPTLTAAVDFRAIEVANGITILGASTTAKASLRIPSGTAPTSPVNGDIWFDGTDIKMRIGGVTKTFTLI